MVKERTNIFKIAVYFISALFFLLVVCWLAIYNRYHVLYFHEQMQLFRFDGFYFHSYWVKPGGISAYVAAFLTQFNFYPWVGATLIALTLTGFYLLLYAICRREGKIEYLFAVLFIPVCLWMTTLASQHFRLHSLVGLITGLAGFRIYITFQKPAGYISGFIIFLIVYILAAGNALLFLILVLIFELFSEKRQPLIYLILLTVWAMIILLLSYYRVYTVNPAEVFFAMTPFDAESQDALFVAAWLVIPVLYAFWKRFAAGTSAWRPIVWKMILSCIIALGVCLGCMYLSYNRRVETLAGMAFNVQNNRYEKAIQLGSSYPYSNDMICYFTNIALAELGLLPHRMFEYDQTGSSGLFLERQESYASILYIGEVYYRLGLIQEAEHSAFEAMTGSPREHNSQTLRRLVTASLISRDTALFNKYIRLFDITAFYRQWADRQRSYMAASLADTAFIVPGAPQAAACNNFFISYGKPDLILHELLESAPTHRLAFEYLMAWYMLNKDMENVKRCLDTYFYRFPYPFLPVHYEEALLVYQNVNPTANITQAYPIREQTVQRFNNYVQAYKQAQANPQMLNSLYRQYGKTYWFYHHFRQPTSLNTTEDETNRY